MKRIGQLQASRNAETRDGWDCFATHREQVVRLLLNAARSTDEKLERRLCVLGAGNCNDLALADLAETFGHVALVDIDEEAIISGITRQGVNASEVTIHGGVDVTGVANLMSKWLPNNPAPDNEVDACIASARKSDIPRLGSENTLVTSICLLSQLIETITFTLGANHPRFLDLLTCIRREHLRLVSDLAVPGGVIVFITDVVSSLTVPDLATAPSSDLPTLVGRAIADRNFFTGMNPFVIKRLLESEMPFAKQLTDVRLSQPWVWDLGPRHYAVCALTATRV
ncbi:MAG: hypothetical protein H8E66_02155 [Planctomycetes bacterium]|nr:hypothetical protein [Planctomycetota bacterium]